jgi:hypothetical protein
MSMKRFSLINRSLYGWIINTKFFFSKLWMKLIAKHSWNVFLHASLAKNETIWSMKTRRNIFQPLINVGKGFFSLYISATSRIKCYELIITCHLVRFLFCSFLRGQRVASVWIELEQFHASSYQFHADLNRLHANSIRLHEDSNRLHAGLNRLHAIKYRFQSVQFGATLCTRMTKRKRSTFEWWRQSF